MQAFMSFDLHSDRPSMFLFCNIYVCQWHQTHLLLSLNLYETLYWFMTLINSWETLSSLGLIDKELPHNCIFLSLIVTDLMIDDVFSSLVYHLGLKRYAYIFLLDMVWFSLGGFLSILGMYWKMLIKDLHNSFDQKDVLTEILEELPHDFI